MPEKNTRYSTDKVRYGSGGKNMVTATMSTKGQVVVPVEVRRKLGLEPGDRIVFDVDEITLAVTLRRRETWDELSAKFTSWIKPGIEPLEDVHGFYNTRPPRL
jgi:AbrB family looped-hinge helix DNA binding protein